jgi:hypothetical protein
MLYPMHPYMIDIEVLQISMLFQVKVDHDGDYFTVRQGKFAITRLLTARFLQNVTRLGFVIFLAKFINQIENIN